ncbi:hypothetical protein AB9K35_16675 [Leisingera sp. XS_AS12]|uniref:hypothetical protein n=1 Tax=Leisingera sp. XS_AS12 TaxID=3241294 RepID=UPI003515B94A
MNKSILGEELERERHNAFYRRFGSLAQRQDDLERPADRDFVRSLIREIARQQGAFTPSVDQFSWMSDVESRLEKSKVDYTALSDRLLTEADHIIKNGRLPSGRMNMLIELVDAAALAPLSPQQIDLLQYLILEAKWIKGEDLDE